MKELISVLEEANFEKNFHLVVCNLEKAKAALNEIPFERPDLELLYNPRNIISGYKYGLLVFLGEDTVIDAVYYASKFEELQSGIVILLPQELDLPKSFLRHIIA